MKIHVIIVIINWMCSVMMHRKMIQHCLKKLRGIRGSIMGKVTCNLRPEDKELFRHKILGKRNIPEKCLNSWRECTVFGELKAFSTPGTWSVMVEWQKMRLESWAETRLWTALWLVESRLYHKGNTKQPEFLKQENDLTGFYSKIEMHAIFFSWK